MAAIEGELAAFLHSVREDLRTIEPRALTLLEEVERLIRAGGSRFRPAMMWAGYACLSATATEPVQRAAASLELLHTFAIIHDDVMDGAKSRRGIPTMPPGLAILAGDLSLVLSEAMWWRSGLPADVLVAARPEIDRMRLSAIAGQYLDLTASADDRPTVTRIGRLKTGSYSVRGPLMIGAKLASAGAATGVPGAALDALELYAAHLGEAFQMADDLNGVFGDPARTGKDRDLDIIDSKPTVLLRRGLDMADPSQRQTLDQHLQGHLMAPDDFRSVLIECGAAQSVVEDLKGLVLKSKQSIQTRGADGLRQEGILVLNHLADQVQAKGLEWQATVEGRKI